MTPMQRIEQSLASFMRDKQSYARIHGTDRADEYEQRLIDRALSGYTSMHDQEIRSPAYQTAVRDYQQGMLDKEQGKASQAFYDEYKDDIGTWDWRAIVADARANAEPDADTDGLVGACYLGSCLSLHPSGKIYAAWTSNQTDFDVLRDDAFRQALDDVASEYGGYIGGNEGDGDSIVFCIGIDED